MATDVATDINPITREVVSHRLTSIVREMGNITLKSARSPVIHSGRDFSCGILNAKGELLVIGTSIPVHIFSMLAQVRTTLDEFEGDVQPGDIFIGNDPHDGGTHLNDVLLFVPVFIDGELLAFACNRAHWYDIGGMVPGSISGNAREIFQEGMRLPPMRIGRNDELDPMILKMISRNVRMPDDVIGDLWAQLASCRVATERIDTLANKYGLDTVRRVWDDLLDTSEQRMRKLLQGVPDRTVVHEGYLDNDGVEKDRRRIRVTAKVVGDEISIDFEGSAPQSAGALNITKGLAEGYALMAVKAGLDPKAPINSGFARPIGVLTPEGSCLNAKPPAAAGGMAEVGHAIITTMVAMSELLPGSVSAEEGSAANHQNLTGIHRTERGDERFIYYDAISCGGGARQAKDGLDFVRTLRSGNYQATSIEVLERLYPILFLQQEMRPDSGGAGITRGGLGVQRDYRLLCDAAEITVLGDQSIVPPGGLERGERGAAMKFEVIRGGQVEWMDPIYLSKASEVELRKGDIVRASSPGGGGWGDPLKRDPQAVLEDVKDGKVSRDSATRIYGVVLTDEDEPGIDEQATRDMRSELAAKRTVLKVVPGSSEVKFSQGVRVARVGIGEALHPQLGMSELWHEDRRLPSVLFLEADPDLSPGSIALDEETMRDTGATRGDELYARPIPAPSLGTA